MIKRIFTNLIKLYQIFISPNLSKSCRFWPSCSDYSRQAVEKYGPAKGLLISIKRILKCYPWQKGGVDLP